jgi:hypothetical protein
MSFLFRHRVKRAERAKALWITTAVAALLGGKAAKKFSETAKPDSMAELAIATCRPEYIARWRAALRASGVGEDWAEAIAQSCWTAYHRRRAQLCHELPMPDGKRLPDDDIRLDTLRDCATGFVQVGESVQPLTDRIGWGQRLRACKLMDALRDGGVRLATDDMEQDQAAEVLRRVLAVDPEIRFWLDDWDSEWFAVRVVRRWKSCADGRLAQFKKPLPWLPPW